MPLPSAGMRTAKNLPGKTLLAVLFLFVAIPEYRAQEQGDLDAYTWRVTALWWYSHPSGSFRAAGDQVSFDLVKDFSFGSYSTFSGGFDWHFKRKHHLLFEASPINSTRTATLSRDVTFQGVTYHAGAMVAVDLNSLSLAPGYQWDFIRRRQGYLALATAVNILDTTGSISGTGTVNNVPAARKASGSTFAPLPILGATGRWYPIHDSRRLSLDGRFEGMYFFGYGNFVYTRGLAQFALHRNLNLTAGYQLGTRLKVKGTDNRVGLRLTQTGPVLGIEASW
jgi:hypothetical protein